MVPVGRGQEHPRELGFDLDADGRTDIAVANGSTLEVEEDLTPSLRYLHPDGNTDDRTVVEVRTETPVGPGETVRFAIEWDSLVPHGTVGRAGWVHDYHFIAQWFPKIGVFWNGITKRVALPAKVLSWRIEFRYCGTRPRGSRKVTSMPAL